MIYTLDSGINLMLNVAGFSGLDDPSRILVAVVLAAGALFWNAARLPRWVFLLSFLVMVPAGAVAVYALILGRQPTCLYAYDPGKPIFADTLERKLTWTEVRPLDCAALWVARNEIFARSNYCFFTPMAHAYFDNDATCDPAIEQAATAIGNANISMIARMEKRRGCQSRGDSYRRLGTASSSKLLISRPTSVAAF